MTDVKRIKPFQEGQTSVLNPVDKTKLEKQNVDQEIQKSLLGNKNAQKERQAELQKQYTEELTMEKKDAKKAAKVRVQDEVAGEKVDNTIVLYDKEEYKQAKKDLKDEYKNLVDQYRESGLSKKEAKRLAKADVGEVEYVKNKKVRNLVESHKDKFFNEDGKFDQDKYKEEIRNWSGDNKLDLSESRATGSQYQAKAKTIRKAANYANFDVQKDKTALKRTLHVAETTGIGAAIGAGVGALAGPLFKTNTIVKSNSTFTSTVIDATTGQVVDKIVTTKPENVQVKKGLSAGQGALFGAVIGGTAGLGVGLATMHKVKDQGEKDVFNGIAAETVVKEGAKGVDGIANAKLVNGILKMENLTEEQKTQIIKEAYGENTGKRVTQRELLAAYEKAKGLNVKPEQAPEEEETPIAVVPAEDDCPKTPAQEEQIFEKEIPVHQYKPNKGEYWAGIIAAKYGISGKDLKEAVHELKKQHGITDFTQNVQPKIMNLPEELNGHKLNQDAKVKERTNNFAPAQKYTGSYINPKTQEKVTVYFYTDCNGKRSQAYGSPEDRDNAMANDKVKKAA